MAAQRDIDRACMVKAFANAELGTCPRRKVGALITAEGHSIGDGYNGAPPGEPHCGSRDGGCEMDGAGHCVTANHAEINAVIFAWTPVWRAKDPCLYCTTLPCRRCFNMLIAVGIKRVVYAQEYRDPSHKDNMTEWTMATARRRGIEMVLWTPPAEGSTFLEK